MQNLLSHYNEIKPENNNSTISEKKVLGNYTAHV